MYIYLGIYCKITLFCRGTAQLSDSEVMAQYDGTHVPLQDMNTFYGTVSRTTIFI